MTGRQKILKYACIKTASLAVSETHLSWFSFIGDVVIRLSFIKLHYTQNTDSEKTISCDTVKMSPKTKV
jgi:hypothetical protein